MFDIIGQSSTRIKTGIVLIVGLLLLGYINSVGLTWLFLGITMMIAIKEAMNLFDIDEIQMSLECFTNKLCPL